MKPLDLLFAIAVPVIWGMGFVVAKAGMDHFPPILLMALRFSLTAFCLVWFFPPPKGILKHLLWVALVSATIQYSLTFTGLQGIDASTGALVVQLEVPFGVLLGYLVFGDRINRWQLLGMLLAFFGAFLIAGEPELSGSLLHLGMVMAGAFVWAIGQVMLKRLGEIGGFTAITWIAVLSTPQLFIASWLFETGQIDAIRSANIDAWLAVAYLGLVMTAVGYAMWYHVLGRYAVSSVMPFLLLLPVAAVVGAVIFLGESLTVTVALGGVFALAGVAMITLLASQQTRGIKENR